MRPPSLDQDQEDALVEGLAAALEALVDRTCRDMGPLWLDATRAERAYLGDAAIPDVGFTPSTRTLALGKSSRSKYRGLAAWRHAVLWRAVIGRIDDADFRDAMQVVYFSPYPDNTPPYAWSSSAREAPGGDRFDSPTSLKHQAKEGCLASLRLLAAERRALLAQGDWPSELVAMLLRPGTRETLRDVLKLEDHEHWDTTSELPPATRESCASRARGARRSSSGGDGSSRPGRRVSRPIGEGGTPSPQEGAARATDPCPLGCGPSPRWEEQ